MTRLVVIVLAGALAWMCWWAFGHIAYEKGLNAWIEQRRNEGWVANFASLETVGFPNRFDTTLTDLQLADPDTGIAWTTPRLQFLSLAYKPHQVIAVLPDTHVFSTPFETLKIAHDDARASLFLRPDTSLPLDRARLVVEALHITSTLGWQVSLDEGRFAAENLRAATDSYRVGAEILGFVPTRKTRAALDPAGILPQTVDTMRFDADVSFDRPWDRHAVEDRRPQITLIDLTELSARWGDVTFRVAGEVAVDADGYPEGQIALRADEWRKLLKMIASAGWLPESALGAVEAGLELMSGRTDTLDATLDFSGGTMRLGLIPLGPAPRLVIR